jgi:transcriptional regulator with XRE-family HTH domain
MNFSDYLQSRSIENKFATVLRAARKSAGFTAEELCDQVRMPLQNYLLWEGGKDFPSLMEWKSVCDQLLIHIDSFRYGYIESHTNIHIQSNSKVGSFKIPHIYSESQATANRWFIPIVEYLRYRLGDDAFKQFLNHKLHLDEDYFYIYGYQVNFNLVQDIFRELFRLEITEYELSQVAHAGIQYLYPNRLRDIYCIYQNPEFIFLNLEQINNRFDLSFRFELIDGSGDVFYINNTSADWIQEKFNIESQILKLYHFYKREWFHMTVELVSHRKLIISEIELDDKRDIECLFQVQVA